MRNYFRRVLVCIKWSFSHMKSVFREDIRYIFVDPIFALGYAVVRIAVIALRLLIPLDWLYLPLKYPDDIDKLEKLKRNPKPKD